MRVTTPLLAGAALLGALLPGARGQEDGHADSPVAASQPAEGPHVHAPGQLKDLVITEGTRLRAPGDEWFAAQAAAGETRFSESERAAVGADGEALAGWVDARGEYVLVYDAEEEEQAYWRNVDARTLTRGRQLFVQYCASCHGFDGAGYGRSAQHLRPPPRSFHQSTFKFTKVLSEQLPSDAALARLVKQGLDGTPMLAWHLSDGQLDDIIQYVKSLSPPETGWRDVYAEIGEVVDIGADPYAADPAAGVARGREVYHRIGCFTCHPGYVPPTEINRLTGKPEGTAQRSDLTWPKATRSSAFDVGGHFVQILPPDFTFHTLRAGRTARDVAETVAAGIGGAGMPQWKGSIPDDEIWAIGHYVRSLVDEYQHDPAKRAAFMAGLRQAD